MGLFLDIIILAILVIFFINGFKKGFIKSVMGLVSLGLSIILAINFYSVPADYINENFISPYFNEKTSNEFASLMNGGTETITPDQILEDKPDTLTDILDKYNVDISALTEFYEENVKPTTDNFQIEDIANELSDFVVGSTADIVSNILGFLLIFIASLIVLNLILNLLNLLFKLPILKFTNKLLGAILGIVKGLILAIIVVNVLNGLVTATGDSDDNFWSKSALESSVSYSTVYNSGLIIDIDQ